MSSGEQEELRLANVLEPRIRMAFNANAQCAAELRRLVADVEHKDAYAEQLGRELAKATAEREADRAVMMEALEALDGVVRDFDGCYADHELRPVRAAISSLKARTQ